jgi:hypothetical protein
MGILFQNLCILEKMGTRISPSPSTWWSSNESMIVFFALVFCVLNVPFKINLEFECLIKTFRLVKKYKVQMHEMLYKYNARFFKSVQNFP